MARQPSKRWVKKLQKPYLSCRTEEQRSRYAERVDMCAEILTASQAQVEKLENWIDNLPFKP